MAFPLAAAVVGGGSLLSSVIGGIFGNKASKAQAKAAAAALAEQRRQYEQDRQDLAPWREAGGSALARLVSEYGLGPGGPDSQFIASPGYQFRFDQGQQAINRNMASRGLLNSGAADKSRIRFGEGLAASEYDSYWNRLAGLAGVGQNAVNTGVAAGQNSANNISNLITQQGNARASSYANTGSQINNGINNVLASYLFSRNGGFGGGF